MSSPYLDEAQAAFLRCPHLDRYSVLSKQYFNLVSTACSADHTNSCQNITSSPYSSEYLSTIPSLSEWLRPNPHHLRFQGTKPDPLAGLRKFPLGYGAQGDACMINSFPALSEKCQESLMNLRDLRLNYYQNNTTEGSVSSSPPPVTYGDVLGYLLIFSFAVLLITMTISVIRYGRLNSYQRQRSDAYNLIVAINANPDLKETVETATGLQVPPSSSLGFLQSQLYVTPGYYTQFAATNVLPAAYYSASIAGCCAPNAHHSSSSAGCCAPNTHHSSSSAGCCAPIAHHH